MQVWIRPQMKKGLATIRTLLFLLVLFISVIIYSLWIDASKFSGQNLTNVIISQKHQTLFITRRPEYPLNCIINNQTQTCPTNYPKTSKTKDLEDTSSKTQCPNYFRWIHEDLRPWNATGISRDMVERAKTTAHFRLIIVKGKAYLEKYKKSIQTRDAFTIWGILQLLRRYPGKIPDLELMFDCDDRPVIQSSDYRGPNKTGPPPLFRYCGDNWTEDIVFPDWSFWGWAEINIKPWDKLLRDLKEGNNRSRWMDREPYAYWKGNPFVAETRKDLLTCNVSDQQDWNARKYSGYTKFQMIKHLLKLVSKTSKRSSIGNIMAVSPANPQAGFKRPRKKESQAHLSIDLNFVSTKNNSEEYIKMQICENAACGATLSPGDAFCKRCSCCICHYYDDNKDPSLWLTCGSDSLGKRSCGLTCHLICALKDERTGIMKTGCHSKLEGSFYCASCRQVNELMRNWRKQLLVAKEARRVDVLCQRVLLGYRMLTGTEQYKEMQKSMETALQLLKNELGPLDLVCSKMARGIVNRLSCGAEVQKLCASTVEAFDSMCGGSYHGYVEKKEPACAEVPKPCASAVEAFDSMFADNYRGYLEQKELTCCQIQFEESSPRLQAGKGINENKNEGMNLGSFSPPTPCNSNGMQEVSGLDCKKRVDESAYEYSVRVVKWLELRGHIAEDFRVKFLTWFSLKATLQDRRVVNVFVDALIDDPGSLAEQLIDTFMDKICCDKKPVPWHGFCTKLWH